MRLDRPPSLNQLGPTTLLVEEQAGFCAPLGWSGYHLRHGRQYTLRVCPRQPDDGEERATTVTVLGGDLLPLAPPLKIASGGSAQIAYAFRPRLRWILPAQTQLTVTLASSGAVLLTLTLPVVVWPSFWRQCRWAVYLFFTVVSTRYLTLIREPDGAPLASLVRVATDLSFLFEASALAVVVLLCLKVATLWWLTCGAPTE